MSEKLGIYEFVRFNDNERADCLWDNGQFVTFYKKGSFKYALYLLSNFYVEVTYDVQTNKIVDIKPFKTTKKLSPYLDAIELPYLP